MSHITNAATKTKLLNISDVHANYTDNVSRQLSCYADSYENKSDKQTLAGLIAESGWSPTETLGVTLLTDEAKAIACAQREETWAGLREAATLAQSVSDVVYKVKTTFTSGEDDSFVTAVSAEMELKAFERLYTKNGKVTTPNYSLVWGFRRTGVLPLANAVRYDQNKDEITKMSFVIMDFESIEARHMICIQENTNKATGLKALSAVDCLAASKVLFDEGATQATLRKTFSHGTGQKLHAFLMLNSAHMGLNLFARCMWPSTDAEGAATPEYIKFSSLNKEKLRELGGIEKGKNQCEAATKDEVDNYMRNPLANQPEKTKTMSAGDLALVAKQHPARIVQVIAAAIATNDKETIKSFNAHAEALNALAVTMGLIE